MKITSRAAGLCIHVALLLLAALLATACGDGKPRTLPFPHLDPRTPFPELADRPDEGSPNAPARSSFADRLTPGTAPAAAPAAPQTRPVPLGRQLSGEIPADPDWSWQTVEEGVTLIGCRPDGGRPAALVYAEAFPARMQIAPSEEIQRFQLTVNPEGSSRRLTPSAVAGVAAGGLVRQVAQGTGAGGPEAARLLQLLATRTAGAGLGFRPAAGSFTGWKWVGRNDHSVTVRLARFTGTWEARAQLPGGLVQRLEALGKIPELGAAMEQLDPRPADGAGGVSASLLVGHATDDAEQSGSHLALLWQHASDPRCIEGLAALLASLRMTGRAAGSPGFDDGQVADLPEAAGLQLLPSTALVPLEKLRERPAVSAASAAPPPR